MKKTALLLALAFSVVIGNAQSFKKTDKFLEGTVSYTKSTGVGAFGRCQFLTVGKNINVFSQLGISTSTEDVAGTKTTTFNTGVSLGAYSFVTKRLALTVSLSDLISYTSVGSNSTLAVGFSGINNPFSVAKFGIAVKF